MDLSLDDMIVSMKKSGRGRGAGRGGGGGRLWGRRGGLVGTPVQGGAGGGGSGRGGGTAVKKTGGDLRDILATKQKMTVMDLRTKIKPKMTTSSPVASGRGGGGRGGKLHPSQRGGRNAGPMELPLRRARSRSPVRKHYSSPPTPHYPGSRRRRESPVHLPSSAETKKITVTVPGLNRPAVSEQNMYRREEHLAATIQRSKEARHESFLRGREEVLAQAITSALSSGGGGGAGVGGGGGGGGGIEREPVGSSYPPSRMRYNRSPSTGIDPAIGGGGAGSYSVGNHAPPTPPISRSKGITTMTTMTISNLSDTVSKNDIAELCGAVGSLETVTMVAPGVAEVVFKYKDDALEAFKKYNQRNLDGQPMICKLQATSRGNRVMHTGSGGGGGGGYGGGGTGGGMRGYMDSYGGEFGVYGSSFY